MNIEEFNELFTRVRTRAFRFESLPMYDMPDEKPILDAYEPGNSPPAELTEGLLGYIHGVEAGGGHIELVRALHDPVTLYEQISMDWAYPVYEETRSTIYVLPDASVDDLLEGVPKRDFWMFDDELVIDMGYDAQGRFLTRTRVPESEVPQYVEFAARLLNSATPMTEYRKNQVPG